MADPAPKQAPSVPGNKKRVLKGKKVPPGPNSQRETMDQSPRSSDPTPQAQKRERKARFEDDFLIPFRPNSFPVLFDPFMGEPRVKEHFLPDIAPVIEAASDLFALQQTHAKWTPVQAEHALAGRDLPTDYDMAQATTLFATAAILQRHEALGHPPTKTAPLKSIEVCLPQSIATVASQLGELTSPALGTQFVIPDVEVYVQHLIRTGSHFGDEDLTAIHSHREISSQWWNPAAQHDPITRTFISMRVHDLLRNRLHHTIRPPWLPFSGAVPWWWNHLFPDDEERERLAWLNNNAPPTLNDWFHPARANDPTTRYDSLEAIPGIPIVAGWLRPQFNAPGNLTASFRQQATEWAIRCTTLEPFYNLSRATALSGSSGSPAQLGEAVELPDLPQVTAARFPCGVAADVASLFAVFPTPAVWYTRENPHSVHADSDVTRIRMEFAFRDLK